MRRSVDDPATPLHEVTFCAVDLETTGGSPRLCDITEVGAARYRGGELLGTFRSLVRAEAPVDPAVTALTGIRDDDLRDAPPAPAVLASLTEFVGGAVLVGHNLRFDLAFLDAALADERDPIGLRTVDTMLLARRLLRDAVPDCRLATLAEHLRLDHRPTHRALDDALATADLLHALLEQAAGLGVALLEDLLELPRVTGHRHAAKLRLTVDLPRVPGAYVLRDGQGEPLDVGHASDVRRHVRALFAPGTPGATPLIAALQAVEAVPCPSTVVAEVAAIRLTAALRPRRSARLARWRRLRVVRPAGRRSGQLVVGRPRAEGGRTGGDGAPGAAGPALGPLTAEAARTVAAALDLAASLPGAPAGRPADLLAVLLDDPASVVAPLRRQAAAARADQRLAAAAATEAMAATLAATADTQRRRDAWRAGPGLLDDPALPAPGPPGSPAEADELDLLAGRAPQLGAPARAAPAPGLRSAAC